VKEPARHGDRAKHSSRKHDAKSKHTARDRREHERKDHKPKAAVGKAAVTEKARKLTPDGLVALCSARAVAESLRIALNVSVSDGDVLGLYWHTAGHPDTGAPILATLEAARGYGIGGWFPAGWRPARGLDAERSVLLGLELPEGPHAVLGDGARWWSWGQPHDPAEFPGAVIEEAWAVQWQ
jgi:hypothetical protein